MCQPGAAAGRCPADALAAVAALIASRAATPPAIQAILRDTVPPVSAGMLLTYDA